MKSFYYATSDQEKEYLKSLKSITRDTLYKFGLKEEGAEFKGNISELRTSPPNIVVASAIKDIRFIQNKFKDQTLEKSKRYVMSLGIFHQLWKYGTHKNLKPSNIKFKNIYNPYLGQDLTDKTLLVTRTGGIGDLLFIQPNLIFLKEKYPSCTIIFACGPQYQSMVENWDCIDEVVDLPFPLETMMESDYQAIFEGVIERCTEAQTKNAYNLFTEWLGLNLPDEKLIPTQEPKEDKVEYCREILNKWGIKDKEFILFQLRTSSPIRTPRPEVWKRIIDTLIENGHKILITDSPGNSVVVDEFISTLNKKEFNCFNFSKDSVTLDCSIAMTSLAKLCISADSALVHVSASLGVKCLGLYGPFPGHIRLKTYGELSDWIDCGASCAPCFIHGHLPCKNSEDGHGRCFDNLDMNIFMGKVEKLLK